MDDENRIYRLALAAETIDTIQDLMDDYQQTTAQQAGNPHLNLQNAQHEEGGVALDAAAGPAAAAPLPAAEEHHQNNVGDNADGGDAGNTSSEEEDSGLSGDENNDNNEDDTNTTDDEEGMDALKQEIQLAEQELAKVDAESKAIQLLNEKKFIHLQNMLKEFKVLVSQQQQQQQQPE